MSDSDDPRDDNSDDPFGDLDRDLGEAMETEPDDESSGDTDSQTQSKTTQISESTQSTQSTDSMDTTETTDDEDEADPLETPAFPGGNDLNQTVYVRDETWEEFKEMFALEYTPGLMRKGAKNVKKRELYDAAFRVAINNPELVMEQVLRTRGVDTSD